MENVKELGEKLRLEREKQGLSFYKVCKMSSSCNNTMNLVHHQVESLEKGEKNGTIKLLMEYVRVLGMKLEFLN